MRLLRLAPLALLSGCIHIFASTVAKAVAPRTIAPREFTSPVRVHLLDGSTIVFRKGVIVNQEGISGAGLRYGLLSSSETAQASVSIDSVAAMVVFERGRPAMVLSIATTVLSNLVLLLGYAIIAFAIAMSGSAGA